MSDQELGRHTAGRAHVRSSSVLRDSNANAFDSPLVSRFVRDTVPSPSFNPRISATESEGFNVPEFMAHRETRSVTVDNTGELYGRVLERFSATTADLIRSTREETNELIRTTREENTQQLRAITHAIRAISAATTQLPPTTRAAVEAETAELNPAAEVRGITGLHPILTDPTTLSEWINSGGNRKTLGEGELRQISQALNAYNFQWYMAQSFAQWFGGQEQLALLFVIQGKSKAATIELIKEFCGSAEQYLFWTRKLRVDPKWTPKPLTSLEQEETATDRIAQELRDGINTLIGNRRFTFRGRGDVNGNQGSATFNYTRSSARRGRGGSSRGAPSYPQRQTRGNAQDDEDEPVASRTRSRRAAQHRKKSFFFAAYYTKKHWSNTPVTILEEALQKLCERKGYKHR